MKVKLNPLCGKLTPKVGVAELRSSASPSFSYGRAGPVFAGDWLFRTGQIPSNITGVTVDFVDAVIQKVLVAAKDDSTYTIGIYTHDGGGLGFGPFTLVDTYVITTSATFTFNVSESVAQNKQVGIKVESVTTGGGEPALEDLGVDLVMAGGI